MTDQPLAHTEIPAAGQPAATPQKLEHLLNTLKRLKSDISCVEARHPGLGNELSSLCDTAITDLNNFYARSGAAKRDAHDLRAAGPGEQPDLPASTTGSKGGTNPIVSVIDKAGSGLIAGLDKTGDGIIFILGKLFAQRAGQSKSGAPAEADL